MYPYPNAPMSGYSVQYDQPPYHSGPQFGAQQEGGLFSLGQILGTLGGGAASTALQDPSVQAAITDLKDQCQVRAKQGVTEWMVENWPALVFGGVALVVGNYLMLSVALLQAGVRGKRLRSLDAPR